MQNAKPSNEVLDVALEDLLGRAQASLDEERIRDHIQGNVVMVTGAAGSIGSQLCRQIAGFDPLAVVGFDQAEMPLYQLQAELESKLPNLAFHSELGNITRFDDVNQTIEKHRPSIVFHAAAYKHLPMLERHMFAALENNVFGTWQVAQASASHGVEHFVLISSDKAVRPTSVMGVTKRIAELSIRALKKKWDTKFVAVRFGNVLGSSGSVAPIFKSQIAAGGPVTVTHPEMKRYFMTASEAGQLLLEALVLSEGGEIFVLDMGEPVKIVDLARNLILLSGLQPDRDIEIEFTGMRAGEKLVEELHLREEQLVPTSHVNIYRLLSSDDIDASRVTALLPELQLATKSLDPVRVIQLLREMVPDYIPSSQLLENAKSMQTTGRSSNDQVSMPQSVEPMLVTSK